MSKDEEKTKELRDRVGLSTIKSSKEKPAANSLSKERIEKLFRMFCFNRLCPRDCEELKDCWKDCSGCLLRDIPWQPSKGETKDLCYAIWHEGILNA